MEVTDFCPSFIKSFVNKNFNKEKLCPHCSKQKLCPYCTKFREKDEALEIFQLTGRLLRDRAACEEHNFELKIIDIETDKCLLKLKSLNSEDIKNFKNNEISKIISDSEEKLYNLYQTKCMKHPEFEDESKAEAKSTSFHFPQKESYQNASLWDISCSACKTNIEENHLLSNLVCGHIICNVCHPKPPCKACKKGKDFEKVLRSNAETYVTEITKRFEQIKLKFKKHIEDLEKASYNIKLGLHCINDINVQYYETGELKDIEVVRREIHSWKQQTDEIESLICKTKGAGKAHNTISFDEYQWGDRFSHIYKYLHEIIHLLSGGDKVYIMTKVKGRPKFGEFSLDDEHLFFDALTLDHAQDEAYFAKLNDLKICARTLYFPFITIKWRKRTGKYLEYFEFTFVVRTYSNKDSRQFIDLCTGEDGISYRHVPCVKGTIKQDDAFESILYVPMDQTIKETEIFNADELTAPPFYHGEGELEEGNLFLIGFPNGSFSVCRSLISRLGIKSFGEVISEDNFSQLDFIDGKNFKVFNCGIQVLHI